MGRPVGRRNADFEGKRGELALALSQALLDPEGNPASFAALAAAAKVSVPTLKHYFGDHDGAVRAALDAAERAGAEHLERARRPGQAKLARSVRTFATDFVQGWRLGVGALVAGALAHGIGHPSRGLAAVEHVLEPTLQAFEARLAVHAERGELRSGTDLRVAALALISPLLLAMLHQDQLTGARCRPIVVPELVESLVTGWLEGYRAR
ncbi:MAG: TetR/AcrR family transcriptional regulator C-terminal ligand-binding domain-containing protein [Deltaproteobacteria bacterium]|nr:TetR/AcrR family transcriptional regulator C-terminal ligand-binding domain-containing protein [Deltaproteobacteria bacterium]